MIEWCRESPWLTFFIVMAILGTIRLVIKASTGYAPDKDDDDGDDDL